MSASWSEGKLPESEAKDCYVLAKEQWMNQGAERPGKTSWKHSWTMKYGIYIYYMGKFIDIDWGKPCFFSTPTKGAISPAKSGS